MIFSMTGYGRGEQAGELGRLILEIRSVNHRFLDLVIRTPRELAPLEDRLRALIQERVDRGRLDVYATLERRGKARHVLQVDKELALAYHNGLKEIQKELNLAGSVDLRILAQLPDVFVLEEVQEEAERYWPLLEGATKQALESLMQMRANEGESLGTDMLHRVELIEHEVEEISKRAPGVIDEYRERLHERVLELLNSTQLDEERLEVEVAYFAERSDITEELVRLRSHVRQFRDTIHQGGTVGRKLNFIIQELHREINTIGSKAGDSAIGKSVVEVKSQIEKLREQVQNIE